MTLRKAGLGAWVPLSLLAAWQILASTGALDPLFFPPPTTLLAAGWQMLQDGELARQTQATLFRMLSGFVVGSVAGLVCGLLMGGVRVIRDSLEPFLAAVYATPKLSLLPLLMLLFGIGDEPRILLVALGCFLLVTMHAAEAVRGIHRGYIDLATNYGASRQAIFWKVYLPASLPQIFTGLRLAVGRALVITVAVELVSSRDGLGSMIWLAWQSFATEKLYIGVFTTAALGLLSHAGLRALETRFLPWRRHIADS